VAVIDPDLFRLITFHCYINTGKRREGEKGEEFDEKKQNKEKQDTLLPQYRAFRWRCIA
jgi:hypothetical protein